MQAALYRAPLQAQSVCAFLSMHGTNCKLLPELLLHSRRYPNKNRGGRTVPVSLSKKSLRAFFAKLLSELQNQILQHDFAVLPLRRVIERERKP